MEAIKKHFFSDMSVMLSRSMRHAIRQCYLRTSCNDFPALLPERAK